LDLFEQVFLPAGCHSYVAQTTESFASDNRCTVGVDMKIYLKHPEPREYKPPPMLNKKFLQKVPEQL